MKRKRMPADTASSAVRAMTDAAMGPPEVPAHVALRECDRPFWDGIVDARARSDWFPNDLVVAAQLARCQADIEREQVALDAEGMVTTNDEGDMRTNPRIALIEKLIRRQLSLRTSLHMGGVVSSQAEQEVRRRKITREVETTRDELADEELLAA